MSEFEIGEVVVYPIHGVARITDIRNEKIGNSDQLCYILETEIKTANERPVIKLPVDKVESNRVRKIVDESEVSKVIEILQKQSSKDRFPNVESSSSRVSGKNAKWQHFPSC